MGGSCTPGGSIDGDVVVHEARNSKMPAQPKARASTAAAATFRPLILIPLLDDSRIGLRLRLVRLVGNMWQHLNGRADRTALIQVYDIFREHPNAAARRIRP